MCYFLKIHWKIISHVAQRNIRYQAHCSIGSFSKTLHPSLQLHLMLLFLAFLGSSLSNPQPVPQTHVLYPAPGPLHRTLPLPGSALFLFPIMLFSGKHSSPLMLGQISCYIFFQDVSFIVLFAVVILQLFGFSLMNSISPTRL